MAKIRKVLFPRKPFVRIYKDVTRIQGTDIQIAHMLSACILALENNGWDVRELKAALIALEKIGDARMEVPDAATE